MATRISHLIKVRMITVWPLYKIPFWLVILSQIISIGKLTVVNHLYFQAIRLQQLILKVAVFCLRR